MTIGSAKGSPGATTVAMLLARELARRAATRFPAAVLVDADPDGGDLALLLGLDTVPGAATLALAGRHGFDDSVLLSHSQRSSALPGVAVVPGIAGRAQRATLDWLADPLGDAACASSLSVVVDTGRVTTLASTGALLKKSDCVLIACGASTASVVHTRSALVSLRAEGIDAKAVVIGETNEPAEEIASALGHPVAGLVPVESLTAARPSTVTAPPQGAFSRSKRPTGSSRGARRSSDTALALLASVVLGEAAPLALPSTPIREAAPPDVVTAALRTRLAATPR
ncbi:MAG: hypothetical protein ACYCSF_02955 [Acidimicrobiales bacterium]